MHAAALNARPGLRVSASPRARRQCEDSGGGSECAGHAGSGEPAGAVGPALTPAAAQKADAGWARLPLGPGRLPGGGRLSCEWNEEREREIGRKEGEREREEREREREKTRERERERDRGEEREREREKRGREREGERGGREAVTRTTRFQRM